MNAANYTGLHTFTEEESNFSTPQLNFTNTTHAYALIVQNTARMLSQSEGKFDIYLLTVLEIHFCFSLARLDCARDRLQFSILSICVVLS